MDSVADELALIRANRVSPSSRKQYRRSSIRFITWLLQNNRDICTPTLIQAVEQNPDIPLKQVIVAELDKAPQNAPVHFESITAEVFLTYIITLRKPDGNKPGVSSCGTHRAGLFNLFRDYHQTMSDELEKELKTLYRGLQKTINDNTARGEDEIRVGKDPLDFSLYKYWCQAMLEKKEKDYVFARCFLIICWNLMCRSSNAFNVRHPHMEWKGDALR